MKYLVIRAKHSGAKPFEVMKSLWDSWGLSKQRGYKVVEEVSEPLTIQHPAPILPKEGSVKKKPKVETGLPNTKPGEDVRP